MKTGWIAIKRRIDRFLRERRRELRSIDVVVGVSRGGLIPAALIATAIDRPLVSAYIDRQDRVYLDRGAWIKGKRAVLVDDIIRSGKTFARISALVERHEPRSVRSFTLFCLRDAGVRPTWTTIIAKDRAMPWDA